MDCRRNPLAILEQAFRVFSFLSEGLGFHQGRDMDGQYTYTPHIWPSVLAVLLLITLSVYSWRHCSVPGALLDFGDVLNLAKAGQMLPLKWRLLDASGNPVLNLDPASVTIMVNSYTRPGGAATDAIETYATGTSTLQNLGDGYYQLNWKTDKAYINSCRKLTLKIGDWSGGFMALFQFKK